MIRLRKVEILNLIAFNNIKLEYLLLRYLFHQKLFRPVCSEMTLFFEDECTSASNNSRFWHMKGNMTHNTNNISSDTVVSYGIKIIIKLKDAEFRKLITFTKIKLEYY